MNDDIINPKAESIDPITDSTADTYTQVASCADDKPAERRRQTLRARLEREAYEFRKQRRLKQGQNPLVSSFRNLFKLAKN